MYYLNLFKQILIADFAENRPIFMKVSSEADEGNFIDWVIFDCFHAISTLVA